MGRESDKLDDFQSPTLAMNLSLNSSSMPENEVSCSPVTARTSNLIMKSYGSKDLDNSTPEFYQSDADIESSNDTRYTPKRQDMDSPHENYEETEKQLSLSLVKEWYTVSETDDLMSQGHRLPSEGLTNKWFPTVESHGESPCSLHHTKRARNLNSVKHRKANLFSSFPFGNLRIEEIIGSLEVLEQKPESSLARCVAQLTLVLESFRGRMMSQTSKMCSYILSAAADKIRQQLQDVESQIMADLWKFNNIGKLKRKLIEMTFQEQQDRLKLIHEKFKEEVRQHLSDCRATLEELGAFSMKSKRNLDRQKASHGKLLLEVKEAMEVQIKDAEASIAVIHKDSRKKMIGLKHALKDWMN